MKVALQLYSIRDFTEKDFANTLKKVAEMGYSGVEFAGYGGLDSFDLKTLLDELKLEAVSSHVSIEALTKNLENEITYLSQLGAKHFTCPWAPIDSRESALTCAVILNGVAEKCKEHGLTLSYHNHANELATDNGELLIDIMLDNAPLLMLEPDLYWVAYAGIDPIEFLKQRIDRVALIHLKQIKDLESKQNVTADKGIIDFKTVNEIAPDIPKIYEQEEYQDMSSIKAVEISAKYMLEL